MLRLGMSNQVKRISVVAAAVLVATFAVGVSPAQALPTGCFNDYNGLSTGYAYCTGGSGEYRAVTRCDNWPWFDYTRYGQWRRPGTASNAVCDSGDQAYNVTREAREGGGMCSMPQTATREADYAILC